MTPSSSEHREQSQELQVNGAGSSRSSTRSRDAASPGARATARWRRRLAKGSLVVPVELFDHEVEALIRHGFLDRADARARRRIGRAVADLVEQVLSGPSEWAFGVMHHSRRRCSGKSAQRPRSRPRFGSAHPSPARRDARYVARHMVRCLVRLAKWQ